MFAFDPLPFDIELKTRWLGHPLHFVAQVDSTNRLLRNLADDGANAGTVILADYQSAGRGRQRRRWESPPGAGLTFSLLLPLFAAEQLSLLPIVTVVAVARALEGHLELTPQVKWPNDVLVEGRKVCGILLESDWTIDRQTRIVVGIGLNVNQQPDAFASLPTATSLAIVLGRGVARAPLLAALLTELETAYDDLAAGWQPHADWTQRAAWLGQAIWVQQAGADRWAAVAVGLAPDGALQVRDTAGTDHFIHAGDVTIRAQQAEG